MYNSQRRKAIRLAALLSLPVLAAVGMSACSSNTPSSDGTASSSSPVNLSFSFISYPTGTAPYQKIAEQYTKSHPNVTFTFKPVDSSSYGQVMRTQFQAKNAPDVMYVEAGRGNPDSVLPFAEAGYLLSLNGQPGEKVAKKFGASLFSSKGKVYGQPIDVIPLVVNVNQTAYQADGLKIPTTLDAVYKNCAAAKAKGKSLFVFAGSAPLNGMTTAMQIAATNVYRTQPDWNELKASGKASFASTPGWTKTLQTIVDLYKKDCFQPGATAGKIPENTPAVASGSSLGSFSRGDSLIGMVQANPQATFRSTVFPATNNPANTRLLIAPNNALAINADLSGAKKKAAQDFLAWLTVKKNADAYAKLSLDISTQATTSTIPPQYSLISKYLTDSKLQLPVPYLEWPSPQLAQDLGTGIQGLLTDQTTIPEVLKHMDEAW
jgi:raffinose/stachyose/melibiose transport system substrate-binding protein